jgi:hypothetical protein
LFRSPREKLKLANIDVGTRMTRMTRIHGFEQKAT